GRRVTPALPEQEAKQVSRGRKVSPARKDPPGRKVTPARKARLAQTAPTCSEHPSDRPRQARSPASSSRATNSCIRFSGLSDVPAGNYAFSATVAIQVTNQMASQLRTAAVACELRPVSQSSPYGFDADRTAVTQFQFHTGDPGEGQTMHLDQQL